ncbi:MAG: sigma-70 family RNA polymerase sigma factor, partial [Pseudomonadota bacterium]|nr:sigma-70 family RNA polymerase sigma factor [Pseudomonadota bacterium]
MTAIPNPDTFANAAPLTYGRKSPAPDLNALACQYLPLIRRVAWHVHGSMSSAVEVEDLIQIGLVALVEAANGFEDRGHVTFEHYLLTRVRGSMIDALRRQATLTRGAMQRRRAY